MTNMSVFQIIAGGAAIAGAFIAYLRAAFSYYERQLEKDAGYRKAKAEDLLDPKYARIYRNLLSAGLDRLNRFFGGVHSHHALDICITLSLSYSLGLFFLGWVVGGPGGIGGTPFIPGEWPWWARLLLTAALAVYLGFLFWFFGRPFRRLIAIGERTGGGPARRLIGVPLGVLAGTGALALAVAGAGAGAGAVAVAVAGAGAGAGAGALAGVLAVAVAAAAVVVGAGVGVGVGVVTGGAIAVVALAIIAGVGALAGADVKALANPIFVTYVLFLLLLPTLNGVWDWASWGISRSLGAHLLATLKKEIPELRKALWAVLHAAIDLVAAIGLLAALLISLTAVVEGANELARAIDFPPPLVLDEFLRDAAKDPWGPDGIWVTLMLLSTLIPTAAHFVMAITGSTMTLWPRAHRRRLAQGLIQLNPSLAAIRGAAWYYTLVWPIGAVTLILISWFFLSAIAWIGEPVAEMLYWLATGTIDTVRGIAS